MIRSITILFVLLASWLTSVRAEAQSSDDEQARLHFMAASSYFDQARYEEAAREFEESYRLSQRDVLLVNIARCYERLLRWSDAATYLERYLDGAGDIDNRITLTTRLESYRERAAQGGGGGGASGLFIGGIVALGLGAASAAVFIGTGVAAHDRYEQLNTACGSGMCPASLAPVRDEGSTLATVSTAFTVISIVSATAGAVLLVVDALTAGSGGGSSDIAMVTFAPLAEGGGAATLSGRF